MSEDTLGVADGIPMRVAVYQMVDLKPRRMVLEAFASDISLR